MAGVRRPFWIHQLVEYLIGLALVGQGLQSAKPAAPLALGAALLVAAGTAQGPLAVAPQVSRPAHRIVDAVVLVAIGGVVLLGGSVLSEGVRWLVLGLGVVHAFMLWKTDYTPPVRRLRRDRVRSTPASDSRSEEIGRMAGRTAGRLYRAAQQRKRRT